jgi:heavy metal sensor kinase
VIRRDSIRFRVALSHAILAFVTLVSFVALASALFWWQASSQLYHHAIQNVETAEGLLIFTPDGQLNLREDYHNHPQSRYVQERLVEIRDFNTSRVLYRNDRLGDRSLGGAVFPGEGVNYSPRSFTLEDGTKVLLVSHVHTLGKVTLLIRQAYSIDALVQRLKEFVGVLCLGLPLAMLFAGWAGLTFAGRLLRPLEEMTRRAEAIDPTELARRLPVSATQDELRRLAVVINGLLDRVQSNYEQMQRFTLDVSHELRTPLAALRSVGEVGLSDTASANQYRDIIGSMLEEANRLTRLVESLLTISRMDAGQISFERTSLNAFQVLHDCVGMLEVLAEDKSQALNMSCTGDGTIPANESMLRQVFINLIHNAIKYTPSGGSITVKGGLRSPETLEISIADDGPGIPKPDRARVFERFHRCSQDQSGAGLGLAIARWIIEAHNGSIRLDDTSQGCRFVIELPATKQRAKEPLGTLASA